MKWYGVNFFSRSTSRNLGSDAPNSRTISLELRHIYPSTTAIVAVLLASVHTVRGCPAFINAYFLRFIPRGDAAAT